MSMRVEQQPAYILHRRPYRETSWLLEVLTADYGRVSLIAKGARQSKSRQAALLQPFRPLLIGWAGRSSLKTLTAIESAGQLPELQSHWLYAGLYVNELLSILLEPLDSAPLLYQLYAATVQDLASCSELEPTLRYFEKSMLEQLGVGMSFDAEAESGLPIMADRDYLWVPQTGFVALPSAVAERAPGARAVQVTDAMYVIPGQELLAIAQHQFESASTLRYAKRLMRLCIDELLNGRPLQSRELFRQYLQLQRS